MFLERLRLIQQRVPGSVALCLVGKDGIPVESIEEDEDLDLEALAAEVMTQVSAISSNPSDLPMGALQQFSITTDRYTILIGALSASYYLLMVLVPEATYGRARFELRRARLAFEDDLD